MYTPGHSRIVSVGAYTPENTVTSREIMQEIDSERRFGIPVDWLERTTGIQTRRVCKANIAPSDMAVLAARQALERAELCPVDIDVIIYAGVLRDLVEPATAHHVQNKLGAKNAMVFDIANACLGFMNSMHVMDALIATGQARYGLVVTGEKGFHYAHNNLEFLREVNDRRTFTLLAAGLTLGDAGGAMLLGPKQHPDTGIIGFGLVSDGTHSQLCTIEDERSPIHTNMSPLFGETVRIGSSLYMEVMYQRLKWSPADLASYIPHQVGIKGLRAHARAAQVDLSKIPNTVSSMGNIITATIPYALSQLYQQNLLRAGQKIYLSGTGSGISAAQAGVVWDVAA